MSDTHAGGVAKGITDSPEEIFRAGFTAGWEAAFTIVIGRATRFIEKCPGAQVDPAQIKEWAENARENPVRLEVFVLPKGSKGEAEEQALSLMLSDEKGQA